MVEMVKNVVGVDVGGTHIRAGNVNSNAILKFESDLLPSNEDIPARITEVVINTIQKVFDNSTEAIGVGVPSLVDENGVVYDVQNIPSWKRINLRKILENEFNVRVCIENDANCFTLAESLYGKGADSRIFVGLTMGTGIGAGIINNGKLLQDANSGSGEFGMLPYLDGIFEDYCSGKFFKEKYNVNGEEIYENAVNGDSKALEIFNEFGMHVGNIIKAIMFTSDPEKIIIGGSVSRSSRFFKKSMMKVIQSFPYRNARENIKVEFSEMLHPGILGAAALCFCNYK